MLTKELLENTVRQMPEEFTIDEFFEEMVFVQKVKQGLEDSEKNNVISYEDVKQISSKWFE